MIWRTFRGLRAHCGSRSFPVGLALLSICGLCWRLCAFQTDTLVVLLLHDVFLWKTFFFNPLYILKQVMLIQGYGVQNVRCARYIYFWKYLYPHFICPSSLQYDTKLTATANVFLTMKRGTTWSNKQLKCLSLLIRQWSRAQKGSETVGYKWFCECLMLV